MADSELDTILIGLHERFATVTALEALLDHEPRSIHNSSLLYSLYKETRRAQHGQVLSETHQFTHRACFSYADPQAAEKAVRGVVTAVPLSVEQDPQLGHRITSGGAVVEEGRGGFVLIDGTVYRVVDFTSTVVVKRPVQRA